MSNLTQFFGAVPSSAATATAISDGVPIEKLSAGDGVRLTNDGRFAKTARNNMVRGAYSQASTVNASSVSGNGLDLTSLATYGRYGTGQNAENRTHVQLSNGMCLHAFHKENNNTVTNYVIIRSFTQDSSTNDFLTFKDEQNVATIAGYYQRQGVDMREMHEDANYLYMSAWISWKDNSNYSYGKWFFFSVHKTTGVIGTPYGCTTLVGCTYGHSWAQGGNGGSNFHTYLNGVFVGSAQSGGGSYDQQGVLKIYAGVYDVASPANFAASGANVYTSDTTGNFNAHGHDVVIHNAASRTLLSFEAPVTSQNSMKVRKHVVSSSGAITTTNVNLTFAISSWTNPAHNKFTRIHRISDGLFAAITAETSTTWAMQKFTYDGDTTLALSGSKIVFTMPDDLTIYGAGSVTALYAHVMQRVNGDPNKLVIHYSANGANRTTTQNAMQIDLVSGTRDFIFNSHGMDPADSSHPAPCGIEFGVEFTLVRSYAAYQTFNYQRYQTGYFSHSHQSKEIVGVALADAATGATDASIALFDGLQSTTALPNGTYVQKNGQYYLMDIAGTTLGTPVRKLQRLKRRYTDSAISEPTNAVNMSNWFNVASFAASKGFNIRVETGTISTTGGSVVSQNGAGTFKGSLFFSGGSTTAYVMRPQLIIDGQIVWDHSNFVVYGYNIYHAIDVDGIEFKTGWEFKIISTATATPIRFACKTDEYNI